MLFHDFLTRPAASRQVAADSQALVTWNDQVTWNELTSAIESAKHWIAPLAGQRVGFQFCPSVGGFANLAALDYHACDACLLDQQLPTATALEMAEELALNALLSGSDSSDPTTCEITQFRSTPDRASSPGVTILTSGTEGRPKAACHTWQSLSRPIRVRDDAANLTWLLAFQPHLYAGLQVILQCFANSGCLVVPRKDADVTDVIRMILDQKVQCVSATPSYWRRLMLMSEQEHWRGAAIRQITLGGEIVDQQILDVLASQFPAARIVHIFATTELGRCFAVTDRQAGFPAALLDHPTSDGIELRIQEGQLWVKSANAMQHYQSHDKKTTEGWWCTGDLVERSGNRVFFLGRSGNTINVGGNKVQPAQLENVIRQVAGVADAQVYGVPSSITGQIVACRIVRQPHVTEDVVRANLTNATTRLAAFERPRVYEFVDQIELTPAGKLDRARRR